MKLRFLGVLLKFSRQTDSHTNQFTVQLVHTGSLHCVVKRQNICHMYWLPRTVITSYHILGSLETR